MATMQHLQLNSSQELLVFVYPGGGQSILLLNNTAMWNTAGYIASLQAYCEQAGSKVFQQTLQPLVETGILASHTQPGENNTGLVVIVHHQPGSENQAQPAHQAAGIEQQLKNYLDRDYIITGAKDDRVPLEEFRRLFATYAGIKRRMTHAELQQLLSPFDGVRVFRTRDKQIGQIAMIQGLRANTIY